METIKGDTLGERCKDAREKAELTQEQAIHHLWDKLPRGRRPGASQLSRIESGKIKSPEPYVIAALAQIYGRQIEELDSTYA